MGVKLILHERIGRWARQFRPRADAWGVRLIESRSLSDLESALGLSSAPIVIVDFRDRAQPPFDAIVLTRMIASNSLILAVIPGAEPHLGMDAVEAGATISRHTTSPLLDTLNLIERWVKLAKSRSETGGWSPDRSPTPEPWETILHELVLKTSS